MRTPLANVDASWHRMEEPANRMVVTGVLVFDQPVSLQHLRGLIEKRLLRFARFRQRIVEARGPLGSLLWEEDPDFSIDHHLVKTRLPAPRDEQRLQELASELASRPFPKGRPPWRFHFVPHYQGGSALLVRLHHAIGDGLALVHVLLSMADGAPRAPEPTRHEADATDVSAGLAEAALALPRRAGTEALALLRDPWRLWRTSAGAANHLMSLVRLLLLPPDPPTPFKGPLGKAKKLVWSRSFRLDDFKAAGRRTDTTVNDVLMAALAGALRRYLLDQGAVPQAFDVRAAVPVNLRPAGLESRLGNWFGLVFVSLPLGLAETRARLDALHQRMRALKRAPDAAAIWGLLWVMGQLPRPLFDLLVDVFGTKATTVVTNVVGPKQSISLLGVRLRMVMFWVPCAGHLGLGVSLLSYADRVCVGLQADAGLIPDPERILQGFEEELRALRSLRRRPSSPMPKRASKPLKRRLR
ncbi:MAG: wax ester/triacylglycerol synthase family O-acyltransferase [Myxococcaceae bacterium]